MSLDCLADLYPYQREGVEWLAPRRRAMLFDEMGLGKSPQAIRAADKIEARKIIVICQAIARRNWQRLFERWGLLRRSIHVIEGRRSQIPADAEVVIINYDVTGYYLDSLGRRFWDLAIIDEAQALKNPKAKRTSYVYGRDGILGGCSRLWILTASPAKNHPGELWTHLRTLYASDMRSAGLPLDYNDFLERFCLLRETDWGVKPYGARNKAELREFLAPRSLCRRAADVLPDLPAVRYEDLELPGELTNEQLMQALLGRPDAVVDQAMLEELLDDAMEGARFRRLCGTAKVKPALAQLEADLDGGLDKIIAFAHHRDVLDQLHQGLAAYGAVVVHGGVSPAAKQAAIDRFQTDAGCRVFLGQLQSVSTSIDLTAACEVAFIECSWTPDDNVQALKRAARIGQTRSVRVRFFSLAGTIDEAITVTCRRKSAALAGLFHD